MTELTLTKDNFSREVLDSDRPVLVDFWAPWCGPCRMMEPIVERIATEFDGQYVVGKVNIDDEVELAEQYRIMSVPTLMVFKHGKIVSTAVGTQPRHKLVSMLA